MMDEKENRGRKPRKASRERRPGSIEAAMIDEMQRLQAAAAQARPASDDRSLQSDNTAPVDETSTADKLRSQIEGSASTEIIGGTPLADALIKLGASEILDCTSFSINWGAGRSVACLKIARHAVEIFVPLGASFAVFKRCQATEQSFVDEDLVACASRDARMRELSDLAGLPIRAGVTLLFGRGGAGKSPVLRMLHNYAQRVHPSAWELFGEPEGEYITRYPRVLVTLLKHMVTGTDVYLDSLKNPVYDTPGSAAVGGMKNEFWTAISDISSTFDRLGLVFCAIVNPVSSKDDVVDNAFEALKTSTCGVAVASDKEWAYVYRDARNGNRVYTSFRSTPEKFVYDGVSVTHNAQAQSVIQASPVAPAKYEIVGTPDTMIRALNDLFTKETQ